MYKVCMHADMHEKQTESVLYGVKALRGHVDASFSARVTFSAFWSVDSHPQLTRDRVNSRVHFFPPTHYVRQYGVMHRVCF